MAKSKKSRRARRQETEKQRQKTADGVITPKTTTPTVDIPSTPKVVKIAPPPELSRKSVNFAQEYFHVYTELRNIFIITAIMFIIMVGLLYVV